MKINPGLKRIISTVAVLAVLSACTGNSGTGSTPSGISSTNFLLGISGFAPRNFPDQNAADIVEFWQTIHTTSEVYGIHIDPADSGQITMASAQAGQPLEVVLAYQDPAQWNSTGRSKLLAQAEVILSANPAIKYLAIGNEVNLLQEKFPLQFPDFEENYRKLYQQLKYDFPEVKIYTVFQYEALLGKGILTGITRKSEIQLLDDFEDCTDLIGLTVYPSLDYKSPKGIPANYFKQVSATGKLLAITETGWPSRQSYGGKLKALTDQGYTSSENGQTEYLNTLVSQANKGGFEFVNWLNLDDPAEWKNGDDGVPGFELFDSMALRDHSGKAKKVWSVWESLFDPQQ